jgi:hypothetical protein
MHGAKGCEGQTQHFFELKGSEWFWIGGIVKHDRFTVLTIGAAR